MCHTRVYMEGSLRIMQEGPDFPRCAVSFSSLNRRRRLRPIRMAVSKPGSGTLYLTAHQNQKRKPKPVWNPDQPKLSAFEVMMVKEGAISTNSSSGFIG